MRCPNVGWMVADIEERGYGGLRLGAVHAIPSSAGALLGMTLTLAAGAGIVNI